MKFHLFWFDKNWQNRGYAQHCHLNVDTDEKNYSFTVSACLPPSYAKYIEVKRKSDLMDFIELLNLYGFEEMEM